MGRVAFAQQWTLSKGTFLVNVATPLGLNHRVVLAWMAVESGGDPQPTAKFNYLQIKGKGRAGTTSGGFAVYRNVHEAAKATRQRIKAEPAIMAARGKGPDELMAAIAKSWDDGAGVSAGPVPQGYLAALKEKYAQISPKDVLAGGFLGVQDPGGGGKRDYRLGDVLKAAEDGTPGTPRSRAQFVDDLLRDGGWGEVAWQVGLSVAMATTGLALIGYGVVKLFGSRAKEVTERVVPAAAQIASRRVG